MIIQRFISVRPRPIPYSLTGFVDLNKSDPFFLGRDRGDVLKFLCKTCEREVVELWFAEELKAYQSAGQYGAIDLMTDWLNADQDLSRLVQIACFLKNGPCFNAVDFAQGLASTWVSVPQKSVQQLNMLMLPKGEVHGVWSLFGNVLLDVLGGKGRNIRANIDENEVLSILDYFFPKNKEAQAEFSKTRGRVIESLDLKSKGIDVKELMDRVTNNSHDQYRVDGEAFLTLSSDMEFSTAQKMILTAIARNIASLKEDEDPEKKEFFTDTITGLKRKIIKLSEEYSPVYTESAWAWIDQEEERELLVGLLMLTCLKGDHSDYVDVKRAIFEKRWLACKVMALTKDKDAIMELEESVASLKI
ncbi:hypothetical protein MTBBW1_1430044 [Desulfamplus magnetovallimortis]|uniref:Uncharacterized protein n=2 Tax=Desulfamplus magnetovallimortis TaxID=1246637 RepID=A0A1W1H874_9BACT|nr:hypothetical protein MTBBW1_1430044 [Desulfamplus magnetovallimortis]